MASFAQLASFLALLQVCALAQPSVDSCKGYNALNVKTTPSSLSADLVLAAPCNVYGADIPKLHLAVTYEQRVPLFLESSYMVSRTV